MINITLEEIANLFKYIKANYTWESSMTLLKGTKVIVNFSLGFSKDSNKFVRLHSIQREIKEGKSNGWRKQNV